MIEPNTIYRHYTNGERYIIVDIAKNMITNEDIIIFKKLHTE